MEKYINVSLLTLVSGLRYLKIISDAALIFLFIAAVLSYTGLNTLIRDYTINVTRNTLIRFFIYRSYAQC